jgi:pyridoxine/pyridoxamine 5'-phosphate oxidase
LLPFALVTKQLRDARGYWLATTRADGSPHAMPLWGVWQDGVFLFDTHPLSQKVKNLTNDPRAVVHLESSEEVVILEGGVEVDEDVDAETFARFRAAFETKYGRAPVGAFAFTPTVAYAWRNRDYRGSATRYEFVAAPASS